jgi:ABC-type multidrug transport system, permease component
MIGYLIEKEFKQFVRNPFLPKLVVMMPIMMMLILPWAANQEIRNINLTVIDNDRSTTSSNLITKAAASRYFHLTDYSDNYRQGMDAIETERADLILEIPEGFGRDLEEGGISRALISANAVNSTKGAFGSAYLASIVSDYSAELRSSKGIISPKGIEVIPQNWFNLRMDYKVFMVPALMVMLLTLICGFLPALNIVSEKEKGTMEQMNVSPVPKFTYILAKLIPYWIIGFVVLSICFLIAWLMYGLSPVGNLLTIYIAALVYILAVSGFGLVISNYSGTMQQAMFVIFFFMLIFILLSGLFTPVSSMPGWAQGITVINPLKYFILIMRQVYLKGSMLTDLLPQLVALGIFAVVSNIWAIFSYRKTG